MPRRISPPFLLLTTLPLFATVPQGLAQRWQAQYALRGRSAGSVSGIYAVHFAAQTAGAGSGAELAGDEVKQAMRGHNRADARHQASLCGVAARACSSHKRAHAGGR
ncbi:hypothetical protein J4733_14200 [Klebsiella pneumoniae]|uniref:Uncharacterized protein n=1 Tax=Klebsiella pneumoniae TaxID=573 RepID=A0A939NR38_KLEPN|nr:hypothetical protein [Klebsiella pneumoniae]